MYAIKNGRIPVGDTDMDYVSFGYGTKPMVIIPGLSDGLSTVKGQGLNLAYYYRRFSKHFRIYIFSRKNKLPQGYTTRDMARDQREAMVHLGLSQAFVAGISQGGMIAQYLAIDYPEMVERLVLGITVSKPNATLRQAVGGWIDCVARGDYKGFTVDMMERTYTEKTLRKYRPFYPLLALFTRPKDQQRFLIQAQACLVHDAYEELNRITCPVLVLGGDSDQIVGLNTSEEIAEKIPHSRLVLYPGLGHGAYDEDKGFNREILHFFTGESETGYKMGREDDTM